MYIDTHGLVQSYLLCENKDGKIYEMLNLYQRLRRQVLLAHLACVPRQLFSRKKIKYVQLNKGCSHRGDGGDRRCKVVLLPGELRVAAAAPAGGTEGTSRCSPLGSALLC